MVTSMGDPSHPPMDGVMWYVTNSVVVPELVRVCTILEPEPLE